MMGGGEFKISLMQRMMWGGTDSKNMMTGLMPCAEDQQQQEASAAKMSPLSSPNSMFLPQQLLQISSAGLAPEVDRSTASLGASGVHDGQESNMPESWSQLLLGGLVGDHERYSAATALLSKGLEEGAMPHQAAAAYNFYGHGGEEIQTSGANKSQVSQMLLASPPRSCITTNLGSSMLDFSSSTVPAPVELRNHLSDNSSEGNNSTGNGSAPNKKARVQTSSSSAQSTLKVRKERLGDRITALHQIVSPFGKTDTASVLQETIGYIRFLLGQIEALSYPYMGGHGANGKGSSMQPQQALLNLHSACNGTADAEASKTEQDEDQSDGGEGNVDGLRSRGLCLVPVSCTSHLTADDGGGTDLWAAAAAPLPQFGGMVWR